jgi:ferric-dicitrate binding protein FerR (iron transport regulator)
VSIVNRRNAILGWLVWAMFKNVASRKARAAVPSIDTAGRRPNVPLVALALAGAGAAAYFWWRHDGGDDAGPAE